MKATLPRRSRTTSGLETSLHERIRVLRRRQRRTLKEIADECGFTVSLLSKIEGGKTTPPVATLKKIADALGVSLGSLLSDSTDQQTVLSSSRKLAGKEPTLTAKGYGFHVLAEERHDKIMQPLLFEAKRGSVISGSMAHPGEEFVYVLEGKMLYRVGSTTYTLEPGDSLYFNAEEDHDLEPLTETVKYLAVFSERPAA